MPRLWRCVLLAVLTRNMAAQAVVAGPPPKALRTDRHGDQLPEAAVARLGTVRPRYEANIYSLTSLLYVAAAAAQRHEESVCALAFFPDGRTLASAAGPKVSLWEPASGTLRRQFRTGRGPVTSLGLAPDGHVLAAHSWADGMHFWDPSTGKRLPRFGRQDTSGLGNVIFSADLKAVVSWRRRDSQIDPSIRLWDGTSGKRIGDVYVPDFTFIDNYRPVAVSTDGRAIATPVLDPLPSTHGRVMVWRLPSGKELRRLPGPVDFSPNAALCLGFSPDGRLLAAGLKDGRVLLWITATGQPLPTLATGAEAVLALSFSPDGRLLATAGEGGIVQLWELASGRLRCRLRGHQGGVRALAFSPGGRHLASGGEDTAVLVWDVTGASWTGPTPAEDLALIRHAWTDLASRDAAQAFRAMRVLLRSPEQGVRLLQSRVRPARVPGTNRVARLVARLDDRRFAARQAAVEELYRMGDPVVPLLRAAIAQSPSAEARRRVQEVLDRLQEATWRRSPDGLRMLRALEVLEHARSPAAQQLLREIAGGAPPARLTREAKAALSRLENRMTAER